MYMDGKHPYSPEMMHYYGDIVRRLFLLGAAIMLLAYPFFSAQIGGDPTYSLIGMILLVMAAGITNPRQRWIALLNVLFAAIATFNFESHAITFWAPPAPRAIFIVDQILAVIFLVALYYAVKTLRGMYLKAPTVESSS